MTIYACTDPCEKVRSYNYSEMLIESSYTIYQCMKAHQELPWEHKHLFKKAFDLIDTNKDGNVSAGELGTAMRSIGLNPNESTLKKVIKSVDADGNGILNFQEFQALMINKVTKPIIDILRKFFTIYDSDNDGYITEDEARQGFASGGISGEAIEKSIGRMFNEQDVNKDGKINFEGEVWCE